jgi:predicted nucleic acid-binding protein
MDALIFIDTNIFLDFYRIRGREAGLSILERVDEHREMIVTSDQVEMEYKKNRPTVILETHKQLQKPDSGGVQLPPIVAESKASKAIERDQKRIKAQADTVRTRLKAVLSSPTRYDPVYKVLQRLFRSRGPYNLSREKDVRLEIRELAEKRFLLGYPPRKMDDTSCGDAINWEWIIWCAKASGKDIVIATRDSDYGVSFDGPVLNDWLAEEFKSRVSRKRRLVLTDRLSDAFKRASVPVTKQEEKAEADLLESVSAPGTSALTYSVLQSALQNLGWLELASTARSRIVHPGFTVSDLGGLLSHIPDKEESKEDK